LKPFAAFQAFQEFQAFQQFQVFQETATHFKSVSRDSKSCQEFQELVSRMTDKARPDSVCPTFLASWLVSRLELTEKEDALPRKRRCASVAFTSGIHDQLPAAPANVKSI